MTVDIPVGLADVGPWGLVIVSWAAIVFGIVRGILVPRNTHETFVKAWETERQSRKELEDIVGEVPELARTTVQLLESIKEAGTTVEDGDRA